MRTILALCLALAGCGTAARQAALPTQVINIPVLSCNTGEEAVQNYLRTPDAGALAPTTLPHASPVTRTTTIRMDTCADYARNRYTVRRVLVRDSQGTVRILEAAANSPDFGKVLFGTGGGMIFSFSDGTGTYELQTYIQAGQALLAAGQWVGEASAIFGHVEWGDPFAGDFCEGGGHFKRIERSLGTFSLDAEFCTFLGGGNTTGYTIQTLTVVDRATTSPVSGQRFTFSSEDIVRLSRGANGEPFATGKNVEYSWGHHNDSDMMRIRLSSAVWVMLAGSLTESALARNVEGEVTTEEFPGHFLLGTDTPLPIFR